MGFGIVLLPGYAHFSPESSEMHLGSNQFDITIADTDPERIKGLSGSSELAEDEAMLFVFDYDHKWSIWMKDMNYPIDIVWLNNSKEVVDYVTNVSPDSYPDKKYAPKVEARYVVEFKSGVVEQAGIKVGDKAVFSEGEKKL